MNEYLDGYRINYILVNNGLGAEILSLFMLVY